MISELRRAFEVGFLSYVAFIIIDMVIASVLMSMGMMMMPPMMSLALQAGVLRAGGRLVCPGGQPGPELRLSIAPTLSLPPLP